MPSISTAQQRFMGMELAKQQATGRNDTGMVESQLHDFAKTRTEGLPYRAPKPGRAKPARSVRKR